jgi:hypothetical protein
MKDDFIREFIKRDLFNSKDLSQIQWRIKGQKLTKEKVLEYMKSAEGKAALNEQKIRSLINNYAESVNYSKNIGNTDDLIDFFNANDNWFNLIFK